MPIAGSFRPSHVPWCRPEFYRALVPELNVMPVLGPPFERLQEPAPDADWERVRDLNAEELGLALAFVSGPSPIPESALRKQQQARDRAREEFSTVKKAKGSLSRDVAD